MSAYKGIRSSAPRSLRTISEEKGTMPAGFTGGMEYSSETGTVLGAGKPSPQAYHDSATLAFPSAAESKKHLSIADKSPFGARK